MGSDHRRSSTAPIPLDRLEMTVRRSSHQPAHTGQCGSFGTYSIRESHSQDKPGVLAIDSDLDSGVKKE